MIPSPVITQPRPTQSTTDDASTTTGNTAFGTWEGRLFGGLVLAAFLLYGIGSTLVDEPLGVGLVALNSIAVTIVGVIGYRLLRHDHLAAGAGYLVTRFTEATFLGGGAVLYTFTDRPGAVTAGYLMGMLALGIGSLPFWYVVGRESWLSMRFALWGIAGYLALTAGALIELTTGREISSYLAVPGGVFEIAVGLHLLRHGFGPSNSSAASLGTHDAS